MSAVYVMAMSNDEIPLARQLAESLSLTMLVYDPCWRGLALCVSATRLELRQFGPQAPGAVCVDFVEGAMGHRRRFGGGRGQLVARAVGMKKGRVPSLVDATAGLGRDAFVLAQLGCQVAMIERSPVVAALLKNGMERAARVKDVVPVIERMSLHVADATQWLNTLTEEQRPDVVYVDPMHPDRSKAAMVKKEMRLFRQLVGGDEDDNELLKAALLAARRRVVVKRPRKAQAIAGPEPDLAMSGKSTRYDVYLTG